MADLLQFGRDVQGYNAYAPATANFKYSAALLSAGHDSITVPSEYTNWIVSFSYEPGAIIWVSIDGTAAAPVGNTFAATDSELLPAQRTVKSGQVIDIYNHGSNIADVGVSLYAIS
jgi:hypothetical protein